MTEAEFVDRYLDKLSATARCIEEALDDKDGAANSATAKAEKS